jgi:hypothetical protein
MTVYSNVQIIDDFEHIAIRNIYRQCTPLSDGFAGYDLAKSHCKALKELVKSSEIQYIDNENHYQLNPSHSFHKMKEVEQILNHYAGWNSHTHLHSV